MKELSKASVVSQFATSYRVTDPAVDASATTNPAMQKFGWCT